MKPKKLSGIGGVTAAKLLTLYGTVAGVFDALDAKDAEDKPLIGGHVAAVLRRHGLAAGMRGLELATLRKLDLDFAPLLTEAPIASLPARAPFAEPVKSAALAVPTAASTAFARVPVDGIVGVDPSHAEWALSLQPRDADEAWRMAETFHDSRLFQKKFGTAAQLWVVILLGREHGLSALAAVQSMYIVDGKVEMDAALIVAKILRSGLARYFTLIESTDDHAIWETHRHGEAAPLRMTFTIAEAQRRELFTVGRDGSRTTFNGKTSNWQKMPDVQCMWRCATKLGRAKYADVIKGLYGQGEIREVRGVVDAEFEAES